MLPDPGRGPHIVDVVLVAGQDVSLGEFLQQRLDVVFMGETAGQCGVDAEDDGLVRFILHEREVFPEPLHLGVAQPRGIGNLDSVLLRAGVLDIVHHDKMDFAYVERIVRRTEMPHKMLCDGIIGSAGAALVVVVAYAVEERDDLPAGAESCQAVFDDLPPVHDVPQLVAEPDADDWALGSVPADCTLDVRKRFLPEALDIHPVPYVGVGQGYQRETVGTFPAWLESEICLPGTDVIEKRGGAVAADGDFVSGRHRDADGPGKGVGLQGVSAGCIGYGAMVSVRHHCSLDALARTQVGYKPRDRNTEEKQQKA